MTKTVADEVWNRAALEGGGHAARPGDRALASILVVHGLVMNGGVHHAIDCVEPAELFAAAEGYAFFELDEVAAFFRGVSSDPILSEWTDKTEAVANRQYAEMVPDDSALFARFQEVFRERAEQFAPLDDN
jgi:hypothetical protein